MKKATISLQYFLLSTLPVICELNVFNKPQQELREISYLIVIHSVPKTLLKLKDREQIRMSYGKYLQCSDTLWTLTDHLDFFFFFGHNTRHEGS